MTTTSKPPGACDNNPIVLKYWDPTRIAVAQTCWRKHWLSNLRGLRSNNDYNIHFEWGAAKHECDQCFDDLIVAGVSREEATKTALILAEKLSWDAELHQPKWGHYFRVFKCSDPELVPGVRNPSKLIENRKRCKWARTWYDIEEIPIRGSRQCECGRPLISDKRWIDDHSKKNRANLLVATEVYCKTPGLPPYKFPNSEPITEVQHIIPLPIETPDGDPYQLVVNIDSIVDHHGWAAIRERKTTGLPKLDFKFWKTYQMGPQIDTYDIVGSIIYVDGERIPKLLVEATRLSRTGGEVEIRREVIPISEERRAEWFGEMLEIIKMAEERAKRVFGGESSEEAFPRNTSACHGQFGSCKYWNLCTQASSRREEAIAENYHVEHWDPLTATSTVEGEE